MRFDRIRVRLSIGVSLATALAGVATNSPAAASVGRSSIATIRTLPVGPVGLSAAVWPAFAVDVRGAVYFFGGSCGAKPASCWCDVMRQRAVERHPTIIAGHAPRSNLSESTPAQRVPLGGCNSIAINRRGIVELLARDLTHNHYGYGTAGIFRIDPRTGRLQEQQSCYGCGDSRTAGPLSHLSLYGVHSGAFDAAGNVYLANDEYHLIQKVGPSGMVSVVMRPHCKSSYVNGPLVEIRGCRECSNSSVAEYGDVFMCPEWPAIGPRGGIYYVDADDNTVRVVDPQGHERHVAGGGACRIARLARCGGNLSATRLKLRDASTDGPSSLALDARGNLYIALWASLLQVTPSGAVHVLAGNGRVTPFASHRTYPPHVPATSVSISAQAVAVDPHGHVYFLDNTGAVREVVH
jgi:hypothetical protein